jgi:hypothetical protein
VDELHQKHGFYHDVIEKLQTEKTIEEPVRRLAWAAGFMTLQFHVIPCLLEKSNCYRNCCGFGFLYKPPPDCRGMGWNVILI